MRNSRAKRDHVLKAAAKLFIEQGFEGTTLARAAYTKTLKA